MLISSLPAWSRTLACCTAMPVNELSCQSYLIVRIALLCVERSLQVPEVRQGVVRHPPLCRARQPPACRSTTGMMKGHDAAEVNIEHCQDPGTRDTRAFNVLW